MDRKPLLIGLLAVVGLGFGADAAYRSYIETPFKELASKRKKAESQVKDYRMRLKKAKLLTRELPPLLDTSLPAQPDAARQQYLAWWWQTIKKHDWQNPSIDLGQPTPVVLDKKQKDAPPIFRIGGTVRGVATLQQATELLDQFYQTPLLHQVESLQMNPVAGGQALSITMSISALSLADASQETTLPGELVDTMLAGDVPPAGSVEALLNPSPKINTSVPAGEGEPDQSTSEASSDNGNTGETAVADTSPTTDSTTNPNSSVTPPPATTTESPSYENIVKRNIFQAGGGMKLAQQITLSAVTQNADGMQQAWFRVQQPRRTEIVDQGQVFRQGVISAKVLEANQDQAILELEGARVRVRIGQTLASGVVLD